MKPEDIKKIVDITIDEFYDFFDDGELTKIVSVENAKDQVSEHVLKLMEFYFEEIDKIDHSNVDLSIKALENDLKESYVLNWDDEDDELQINYVLPNIMQIPLDNFTDQGMDELNDLITQLTESPKWFDRAFIIIDINENRIPSPDFEWVQENIDEENIYIYYKEER